MNLINEDLLKQILSFYSGESRTLIEHQIKTIEKIITQNIDLYSNDKGYQRAMDYILKQIIEGEFIIKKE